MTPHTAPPHAASGQADLTVTLQRPTHVSRTHWITAQVRAWIADEVLHDGDQLPGSVQLMELFDVSLVTLNNALTPLKLTGEVTTTRSGRFVGSTPPPSATAQVTARLCTLILDGTYPPGTRIPPMPALAADLKVSAKRIQDAQDPLKAAGILRACGNAGTFVTDDALARIAANPALHTPDGSAR